MGKKSYMSYVSYIWSRINFAILLFFMRRRLNGIEGPGLLSTSARVALASAAMGAVCWLISRQLENHLGLDSLAPRLVNVSASVAVGVVVFYLAARLLKVDELTKLTGGLARKFGARFRRT